MHYHRLENGQPTSFASAKMHLENTVPGGPYVHVPRIFQVKLKNYWNDLKCFLCESLSNSALVLTGIRKADVAEKGGQESDLLSPVVVKPQGCSVSIHITSLRAQLSEEHLLSISFFL